MNYRHAFHAGGVADVVKHAVLALIVIHLRGKPAAFRVIDTHAGAGLYDLTGPEASRTGEWRDGIGRLWTAPLPPAVRGLLGPYLEAIGHFNPTPRLVIYPGSPAIVSTMLRPHDRLTACELEPGAAQQLAGHLRSDRRAKAIRIDGWTGLSAYLPPKERRGLVLIDPSFEQPGELARLAHALAAAHRKWMSGTYLVWYPIKNRRDSAAFIHRIAGLGIPKVLRAEFMLARSDAGRLKGGGLLIVNPPWTLEAQLAVLLPALASILAPSMDRAVVLQWVLGQK